MPAPHIWLDSIREARANLQLSGAVMVGGETEDGQRLLAEARAIMAQKQEANPPIVVPRKAPDRVCVWRPGRPRENLVDLRYYVDNGKGRVAVSENPSWYPGVSFKNGNGMKQVRANKQARDLDSWCVCWATRDEEGKPLRLARHFYVGQFYTKNDQNYDHAKRRARQFAIEFRKAKVKEYDEMTRERDRLNFERLRALDKLHQYRAPRNRVAARQSGRQGVTWMKTSQSWQVQLRVWDPALRKSRVMKQCHVRIAFPDGTTQEDDEAIEAAVEKARLLAIEIRKEWERRYRVYTVKHYALHPRYDENGKLIEDEPENDPEHVPEEYDQYGNPKRPAQQQQEQDFAEAEAQMNLLFPNVGANFIADEGDLLPEELDGFAEEDFEDVEDDILADDNEQLDGAGFISESDPSNQDADGDVIM
ncbi:unnamed protein product [Amoebophrya sp. A120]|nr:unnamed protein product [Amoebophrya sp. A120]|eukprot:GSA120T00017055001.1